MRNGRMIRRPLRGAVKSAGASAAWTPADLGAKVTLWLDERDIVGDPVSDWGDQSAGGTTDFTQGTAGKRPAGGRTLNGLAGIDCVSNDYLDSAAQFQTVFSASSLWLDVIFVPDATGATDASGVTSWSTLFGNSSGGYFALGVQQDGSGGYQCKFYHYDGSADYVRSAVGSVTLGAGNLIRIRHEGGNLYAKANDTAESAPVASGNTSAAGLTLGLRMGSTYTGGAGYDGGIFAVLGGSTQLSAGERASLDAYWATQYGVTP